MFIPIRISYIIFCVIPNHTEERKKSDKIAVEFQAFERTFHLKLTKNKKLFSPHYQEMYQENGKYIRESGVMQPKNNCHYSGSITDYENSWVSINICQGVSGIVFDGTETFHLHYFENISELVNVISKASEMRPLNISCGNEDLLDTWDFDGSRILNRFRRFSEWQFSHLRENRRILELCMVADRKMFEKYGRQREAVSRRVREIINIVHGLYLQLNIVVVLTGFQLWNVRDEIAISSDPGATLNKFSDHAKVIMHELHCDDIQLITNVDFNGDTVGLAFVGAICGPGIATGVNQDYHAQVTSLATTVAHEIGHNFNMSHDVPHCKCPNNNCIMGTHSASRGNFFWSSCSREALTNYLSDGMDSCLKNFPKQTVLPVCGDGVIQNDEQCDCGQPQICDNPCCNATSCQLYENATCAAGTCCNLETCKLKEIATPCREVQSECDIPEFCDGKSPICPEDVIMQDGTECKNGKAFCFQGGCQSHDDQCHLLFGSEVQSSDLCCYKYNTKGTEWKNCGTDPSTKSFHECPRNSEDVLCGSLKCNLKREEISKLKFRAKGMKRTAWKHKTCLRSGHELTLQQNENCFSISIDSFLPVVDPGHVPNGAKCEENMMCLKNKCVHVDTVRKPRCPKDCSGNGQCNSKGNCHCIVGFGPPACDTSGPGGSVDSGPASHPDAGKTYVTVMYVVFFGVCPLVLITVSAVYFFCSLSPKIAAMERCKQEKSAKGKRTSFRTSLKRLRKLSVRSVHEDISYDSFSSDEETSTSTPAKVLPDIPRNPPRTHISRKKELPELFVKPRPPMKPASSGISQKPVLRRQFPVPPVNRNASQHSLHAGVILKVPDPEFTALSQGGRSIDKRGLNPWNDESQHLQTVSSLAKLYEKK